MLEKLRQSCLDVGLPCEQIQQSINGIRSEFLPKFLELLDANAIDRGAMPPHVGDTSKEEADFLKAQIAVLMAADIPLKLTLARAQSSSNSLGQSLPYESLINLVVQQVFRGLTCIDKELQLHTQAPLLNALYAQGMLQAIIHFAVGIAVQRWLEHDLTEQQWHDILDEQYEAFARVVPPSCAIIAAFNKERKLEN